MVVKRTSGGQQHRNGEGDGYMTEEKNMKEKREGEWTEWVGSERKGKRSFKILRGLDSKTIKDDCGVWVCWWMKY